VASSLVRLALYLVLPLSALLFPQWPLRELSNENGPRSGPLELDPGLTPG
jgi:hypothetical protein